MRIIREQKGTVTIYLSIVFMAMILFTGVFVDLARIRIAQNQLRRITNSAARSVLAGYDPSLKNQYGLFAVKNDIDAQGEFQKYVKLNLGSPGKKNFKLLDWQYENSELVLSQPIDNLTTLKQQVLEDMKYSAPIEISKELIDKFKAIASLTDFFGEQNQKQKIIKSANSKIGDISEINSKIREKKDILRQDKLLLKSSNEQLEALSNSDSPGAATLIRRLREQKSEIIRKIERDKAEIITAISSSKRKKLELQREIDQLGNWPKKPQNTEPEPLDIEIQNNMENFTKENLDVLAAEMEKIKYNTELAETALNQITADEVIDEDLFAKIELDPGDKISNKFNNKKLSDYRDLLQKLTVNRNVYRGQFEKDPLLRNSMVTEDQVADIVDYRSLGATDQKLDTQEQMFRQISGILNVNKKLSDMRNELYLNEYLLTHCSFITSEPKGDSSYEKRNLESEYVLYGSNPLEKAVSELYMTRFALDTLGYMVFSKPPAPVELLSRTIYSLIMGAMQASVDTYKLLVDGNNAVNITEMATDNPLEKLNLTLTYRDHLRLFMLLHSDEEGKLKRLMGVIRERDNIETREAFTLSDGSAIVSIKLWFLPLIGLKNAQNGPFQTEIRNGRCYINKYVEFGY